MLGFFTWFVLGDAAVFVGQVAVDGVAGVAGVALWQTVLSVLVVAVPLGFAALVGHHVRRDAGSMALAAAAMTATVLIAGMAEIGIAALLVLSLGS